MHLAANLTDGLMNPVCRMTMRRTREDHAVSEGIHYPTLSQCATPAERSIEDHNLCVAMRHTE